MIKEQATTKIKDLPKVKEVRKIIRQCVICGKNILVKVFASGEYTCGHYFGEIEQAKKYIPTGETMDLGKIKSQIVKPAGKVKKWEYWECEKCYNNN